MKNLLLLLTLFMFNVSCFSQNVRRGEINKFYVKGASAQSKEAKSIAESHKLNNKGELLLSIVKEFPGKNKEELFGKIRDWVIMESSPQSSVQLIDESTGTIINRCYISDVAYRSMGDNSYKVSIRPLLKYEFKDEKIRFTYILQSYEILKKNDDSGYAFIMGNGIGFTGKGVTTKNIVWALRDCYPYTKDSFHPKVTASRALIGSMACYNIICEKIDHVIAKEAPPSEQPEDW